MRLAVVELLSRLDALGVRVAVEGDELELRAPMGAITPLLRDELRARKSELIAALSSAAACRHETRDNVAARWESVQARPAHTRISGCVCCGGPALLSDTGAACTVATPRCSRCRSSAFLHEAQALAPRVRLTIRATADEASDRSFVAQVWALLREHEGENLVFVRLIDADGRAWRVRDRALATPELRRALARLLAARAMGGA